MKSLLNIYCIASLTALTVLSGCTNDRTASRDTEREQVISREVTPNEAGLADNVAKRGETEVQAQKEIITKKTETMSEDVPTVATGQEKLDINRMNAEDFAALGLDRSSADAIVQFRDKNGNFNSMEDLKRVPGLNSTWLNKYRDRFAFVSPKDASSKAGQSGEVQD